MSDDFVEDGPVTNDLQNATGKKKSDLITSIILLAFSAYLIIESLTMSINAEYGPGPGFFPLGLGIILAILSIALIIENINPKKKDKASPFKNKAGILRSGLVIAGLVFYALVITKLGYLLTTLILVLYLMGVVARDKIKTTVITAVCVTLMLFLIFDVALGVRLPKGPFGF